MPVRDFMCWCAPGGKGDPLWCVGKVVKKLSRHKQFTHDARFVGHRGVRGVCLAEKHYLERCWYYLRPK